MIERLLGVWIALAIVASGTVVAVDALDLAADETTVGATPPTTPTTADESLRPDQLRVTGTITALHIEGAQVDPQPVPLTIDSPERGSGNGAEITGIAIDGKPVTIVWDAGRPLEITGGIAIELDPVNVDLSPVGVVLSIGDAIHGFTPGVYQIDTPVALGQGGLARPRDTVTFDAGEPSAMEVTGSPFIVVAPPRTLTLRGPGRVVLTGELRAITADSNRPATSVELPAGPFEIEIKSSDGGYTIEALLQGAATIT